MKTNITLSFYILLLSFFIVSCDNSNNDNAFSSLETTSGLDLSNCEFTSTIPEKNTIRVANDGNTKTQFVATTKSSQCEISYEINGAPIDSSEGLAEILSSQLNAGVNKVKAKASNAKGAVTHEWVVQKNSVPSCNSMIPSNSATTNIPIGITSLFLVSGLDLETDPIAFEWTVDNQTSDKITTTINASTASQIQFTPDTNYVGTHILRAKISDGFDTTVCQWNVNITGDCSITSTSPSPDQTRVSLDSSKVNIFQVNTASNGCVVDWKLNGASLSGTESIKSLSSSLFINGANILTAQTHSGGGTLLKQWTVFKNNPPTCIQTPTNASLLTTSVGASTAFSVTGTDSDSDAILYSWTINNATVSNTILNYSSNSVGSTALLSPSVSQVGLSTLTAVLDDSYDQTECDWPIKVLAACTINSSNPSSSTVRVSRNNSVDTIFAVTPNDSSCGVVWTLNGVTIGTSSIITLNSQNTNLNQDVNTLTATVSSGFGTPATQTWSVNKNRIPTCPSQNPSNPNASVAYPNNINFLANGADADNDSITFDWKINGQTNNTVLFTYNNLATSSQAQFNPEVANIGNNAIQAFISDGYDGASCGWNVAVSGNCAIDSVNPSAPMVRALSADAYQSVFQVTTTTPGCSVLWTLNGLAISGTESTKLFPSSLFLTGANSLIATVSNGSTISQNNWTVVKNSLPTCSAQTPAVGAPIQVGVGASQNFTTTGADQDTDSISTTWKYNGVTQLGSIISAVPSGNNSTATFTPDSSFTGLGTLQAILNDGYETNQCTWPVRVIPSCSVASYSPLSAIVRIPSIDVNSTNFSVVPNDSACTAEWFVNGASVGTNVGYALASNNTNLTASDTVVKVVLSNGYGQSVEQQWTARRNTPPICSSQVPSNTSQTISIPGSVNFTANGADSNGDSLTFDWKVNGATNASLTSFGSTSNSSSAQFNPTIAQTGNNNVTAEMYDGYDHSSCTWNVAVSGDCSISSSLPAQSSFKVADAGTTQTMFTINTQTAGCSVNWQINGSPISGTESIKLISSSSLAAGNNIVTATVNNGASQTTASWTVAKNNPPVCSQNPSNSSTVTISLGQSRTFVTTALDPDASDTVSAVWKNNGLAVGGILVTSATAKVFYGVFTPTLSEIGTNILSTTIDDGYDSNFCSWNTQVYNSCSIVSHFPTSGTFKLPSLYTNTTGFGVIPNDASCGVTWTLNGSSLGFTTLFDLVSDHVLINPNSSNTLVATVSNGIGTPVTQTWTILKNHAPQCFAKTPSNSTINMWYSDTQSLASKTYDSDGDSLTYNWSMNSAHADLFSSVVSSGTSSAADFAPTYTYLGNGQSVSVSFTDGYDSGNCAWSVNVLDPVQVNIGSSSPSSNFIVLKSRNTDNPSVADSQNFSVSVSSGLSVTYQWFKDGVAITNATLNNYTVTGGTGGNWPSGIHDLKVVATDTYANTDDRTWQVKRNTPPTIEFKNPSTIPTIRMNYGGEYTLELAATDADNDDASALSFQWYMDGLAVAANSSHLPWNSPINWDNPNTGPVENLLFSDATFSPLSDSNLLGAHVISVTVFDNTSVGSDNRESSSYQWNLQVNQFSSYCNDLYNRPVYVPSTSTYDAGKNICTLVGDAGVGGGRNPTVDQTKIKQRSYALNVDGANLVYSDGDSHTVFYYNQGASDISRCGKTIAAGKIEAILGTGAAGDSLSSPSNTIAAKDLRLNNPRGVDIDIIDATHHNLFVADYSNHRVIRVDETGTASVLLGGTANNTAATNTDGVLNSVTQQTCYNPYEVKVVNVSGTKWLFVTCSHGGGANASIKKVNIDTLSANYKKVYSAVGRIEAAGTTVSGIEDGLAGKLGEARVYAPYSLRSDELGNVYWSEYVTYYSGTTMNRIRVLNNLTSATLTYFENGSLASPTVIMANHATNTASGWPASGATYAPSLSVTAESSGAATTQTLIYGPTSIRSGICTPYRLQFLNASNQPSALTAGTTITITAVTGTPSLYSNSGCSSALSGGNLTVTSGVSEFDFYVSATGAFSLRASGSGTAFNNTLAVTISSSALAFSKYNIISPTYQGLNRCSRVYIQQLDASNNQIVPASTTTARLGSTAGGTFYSDAACTVPITSAPITAGNSTSAYIFFSRAIRILPNSVGTILHSTSQSVPAQPWFAGYGALTAPQGFDILHDGSSNPIGIFMSMPSNHVITYTNFTTTALETIGGVTFGTNTLTGKNYEMKVVTGVWNSNAFNGDGRLGPIAKLNGQYGLKVSSDNNKLYIADRANARIRYLDLSTNNGTLETILGAGKTRSGWNSDGEIAASTAFLSNPTYISYDPVNNGLILSDSSNRRVRSINLEKGTMATILGTGSVPSAGGDTIIPNEDPFALLMRGPMQNLVYNKNGKDVVLAIDRMPSSNAANTTCGVRGYNRDVNPVTLFAQSIFGLKVTNLVGDYPQGCATASGIPDGTDSTLASMYGPEGLAVTNDNQMFISVYNDNCIVRVDPTTGYFYKFIGPCNGTLPGAVTDNHNTGATPATVRYPKGLFVDPMNTNNFFFVDSFDQNVGRIRYVNRTTSDVQLFGNTVTANKVDTVSEPTAEAYVTSILSLSVGTTYSRYNSVAAFDKWICWSSGLPGTGTDGPHNVVCVDRTDSTATRLRIAGADDQSTYKSAGSPLGLEQEGVPGTSARLFTPYGLAFDADGNLYISEYDSSLVRMVRRWW